MLAHNNSILLELAGGTMPPTTTAAPTMLVQGVKVQLKFYEAALLAATGCFMLFLWAFPLMKPIKRRIESRIFRIYPVITFINFCILGFVLHKLQIMKVNDLFFLLVKAVELALDSAQKVLMAFAALIILVLLWKFKDRILETLGVDNPSMVVGEFRDWATCWSMKRFYPIEVFIWKVEGLPAMHLHQFNDVFVEVSCGYNNVMRTRVHLRAGHGCIFKESLQLNFDHFDTDTRFNITLKNQDVMGSTDIAALQLGASQVKRLLDYEPAELDMTQRKLGWGAGSKNQNSVWQEDKFKAFDLIPAGQIFVQFRMVEDQDKARGPSYGKVGSAC
jgi:hypothetical protein